MIYCATPGCPGDFGTYKGHVPSCPLYDGKDPVVDLPAVEELVRVHPSVLRDAWWGALLQRREYYPGTPEFRFWDRRLNRYNEARQRQRETGE